MLASLVAASVRKLRPRFPRHRTLFTIQPGNGSPPSLEETSAEQRSWKDPGDHSVLLFPGQGSQFVGMGRGLLRYPNVGEMFEAAREILGYDLLSLCLNGPEEDLSKTVHCQPAVFVTSLAAVEKLNHQNPKVNTSDFEFSFTKRIKTIASIIILKLILLKSKHCYSHDILNNHPKKIIKLEVHVHFVYICGHKTNATPLSMFIFPAKCLR